MQLRHIVPFVTVAGAFLNILNTCIPCRADENTGERGKSGGGAGRRGQREPKKAHPESNRAAHIMVHGRRTAHTYTACSVLASQRTLSSQHCVQLFISMPHSTFATKSPPFPPNEARSATTSSSFLFIDIAIYVSPAPLMMLLYSFDKP